MGMGQDHPNSIRPIIDQVFEAIRRMLITHPIIIRKLKIFNSRKCS